jgi:hypothetical protein
MKMGTHTFSSKMGRTLFAEKGVRPLFLKKVCVPFLVFLLLPCAALAQDAGELAAERAASARLKGEHPLAELMRTRHSQLKPELAGVHPRVYVTAEGLKALQQRARTTHKDVWRRALANVRALKVEPPAPPAQERRVQNEVGMGIAEAALAYKIEGDRKYLAAAKKYMDAAVSYDIWGYAYNKPDVDLAAGHLLYGLGWGYDLLYHDLTEAERKRYRDKLVRQARLMHDFFKPKEGKTYAYSQNHTSIPIAGLGVAAYALYGEVPEAAQWAALARAIFDRVLATYSESAGRTDEPWLGPDVSDMARHLAGDGIRNLLICPIGFVSDHLEVLYDIDIELQALAESLDLRLERTESLNDHPLLLEALAARVQEAARQAGWA